MINNNFNFKDMMASLKKEKVIELIEADDKKFFAEMNTALKSLAKAAVISKNKELSNFLIKSKYEIKLGIKKFLNPKK